jgi:hypothetical protein
MSVRSQTQYCYLILEIQQLRRCNVGRAIDGKVPPKREDDVTLIVKMLWSPIPYQCGKHMPCPISSSGLPKIVDIREEPLK